MLSKLNADEQVQALLAIKTNSSPSIMKIKALLHAYGTDKDFISFYSNENYSSVVCIQDSVAVFFLVDSDDNEKKEELAEFLSVMSKSILGDIELPLCGYRCECGKVLMLESYEKTMLSDISQSIQDAYDILSDVFSSLINSNNYYGWYADLSHRVRHQMSKVYTIKDVCTATSYLCDNGCVIISQLATMTAERNKGYAKKLMFHAATDQNADKIMVLSQSKESDSFYYNLGFNQLANWYLYES